MNILTLTHYSPMFDINMHANVLPQLGANLIRHYVSNNKVISIYCFISFNLCLSSFIIDCRLVTSNRNLKELNDIISRSAFCSKADNIAKITSQ